MKSNLPKRVSTTLSAILLSAVMTNSANGEEFVEWVGANSGVNWSAGQVTSEGAGVGPAGRPPAMARLMACRAAVVDAQRNLLESIQGVRVEGTTVVANMMVESDVIKTSVSGLLQGAQVVERKPQDDGSCVVTMTAPLGGKFTTDVYGEVFDGNQTSSLPTSFSDFVESLAENTLAFFIPTATADEATTAPWQTAMDQLASRITSLEELLTTHPTLVQSKDTGPTGLVLDARGSNFIPSMSPKIRQLRKGVMYPTASDQLSLRERGQLVSLFTRDLDTAKRHPVVGERPVVLKALRTWGKTRTEIVLGTQSSERLTKMIKDGFMKDAGVIIVL